MRKFSAEHYDFTKKIASIYCYELNDNKQK